MKLTLVVCLATVFAVEVIGAPKGPSCYPDPCKYKHCFVGQKCVSEKGKGPYGSCTPVCVEDGDGCRRDCGNPCAFTTCQVDSICQRDPKCNCRAVCVPKVKETCVGGPETGNCRGYFPSWYYDTSSRTCKEFIYGGCGGNGNKYETKEDCMKNCQKPCDNPCHRMDCGGNSICEFDATSCTAKCKKCPYCFIRPCSIPTCRIGERCVWHECSCATSCVPE